MNKLVLKITFQIYHQVKGTKVYTKLKELRNTQWLSEDESLYFLYRYEFLSMEKSHSN